MMILLQRRPEIGTAIFIAILLLACVFCGNK
jgi:hypothetical protein